MVIQVNPYPEPGFQSDLLLKMTCLPFPKSFCPEYLIKICPVFVKTSHGKSKILKKNLVFWIPNLDHNLDHSEKHLDGRSVTLTEHFHLFNNKSHIPQHYTFHTWLFNFNHFSTHVTQSHSAEWCSKNPAMFTVQYILTVGK